MLQLPCPGRTMTVSVSLLATTWKFRIFCRPPCYRTRTLTTSSRTAKKAALGTGSQKKNSSDRRFSRSTSGCTEPRDFHHFAAAETKPKPKVRQPRLGTRFERFNFWVYGVALKTAPCILLSVLSALLIRAMRAAELRHRRLVQRRPMFSSFSASPRMDTPACTVRRHHTFEEPRNPSQSELNGATLVDSPAGWKRSFSERIRRSAARLSIGEEIRLGKVASSADKIRDNPSTRSDNT